LDFNEEREDGRQWHQLNHMQIICTSLQTDNNASITSLKFFIGWMLFLTPNQQCQSTEGWNIYQQAKFISTLFTKETKVTLKAEVNANNLIFSRHLKIINGKLMKQKIDSK